MLGKKDVNNFCEFVEERICDYSGRARNEESSAFQIHTTVQIPEISSFRLSETDMSARRTSLQEISKQLSLKTAHPNSRDKKENMNPSLSDSPLPVVLKFEDVKFKVEYRAPQTWGARKALARVPQDHSSHKQILNGITGFVAPGEILAIMGPSGSGKTSLLNILAGRLRGGVTGNVTYNDIPYTAALKRRIGFVTQDDVLFPQLTVQETMIFAALLRLPHNMTQQQKIMRAETVIRDLGLERCRHTRVGGVFVPGISGGERKRTSIGYEILVDPSLLLLDEPTSGLDSSTALKLIQVLQKTAKAGRTIITTIHQPSSRLFHMFDKLIVISEGHTIYSGQARGAMPYFASLHFVPELAMNPADFLLDLATGNVDGITVPEDLENFQDPLMGDKQLPPKNHDGWTLRNGMQSHNDFSTPVQHKEQQLSRGVIKCLQTKYITEIEPQEKMLIERLGKAPEHLQAEIQAKRNWTSSWVTEFVVLSKRTFRQRATDYLDNLRLFQAIGVSSLLGLLWWQSKIETEAQLRDQVGLVFYVCIFWSTSSLFASLYNFPLEQKFLAKERAADMYRLTAYQVSSTLCDVPAQLLYPTIFMSILYFMAGFQRTASAFVLTQLSIYLIVLTGQGIGEFVGASILSVKRAGTVASLALLVFMLMGGYYVQHVPGFIKWMKYVSSVYYGFRLLLKVQYSPRQTYECSEVGGCRSLQTSPSFDGIIDLNGGVEETCALIAMSVLYRIFAYIFLRRIRIAT